MEYVILVGIFMFFLGVGMIVANITDRRMKLHYKAAWVQHGRDAAEAGRRRFIATASWIQEFYDEGYDAVINEKEAANV